MLQARAEHPRRSVIDLSLSISDLSNRAGVTSRQVTRDVAQLLERIGMPLGFRSIVAEQRVRLAVLFLSSPHARPEEVAAVVGYAGVESMAAAFRDAELPTPGEVLQRLREART